MDERTLKYKGVRSVKCITVEVAKKVYDMLSAVTDEYWSVAEEAREEALQLIEQNQFEVDIPDQNA